MGKKSLVVLISHEMMTLPTLLYLTVACRVGKKSLVVLISHEMMTLPTLLYLT
ncbi:MAG: hypothetical protein F6K44_28210 [Moorea sp. SIO3E2]|nr:hypothetical protein [Moorena sp. SIO3E2]